MDTLIDGYFMKMQKDRWIDRQMYDSLWMDNRLYLWMHKFIKDKQINRWMDINVLMDRQIYVFKGRQIVR